MKGDFRASSMEALSLGLYCINEITNSHESLKNRQAQIVHCIVNLYDIGKCPHEHYVLPWGFYCRWEVAQLQQSPCLHKFMEFLTNRCPLWLNCQVASSQDIEGGDSNAPSVYSRSINIIFIKALRRSEKINK